MMKKNLKQVWDQLRAENVKRKDKLNRVSISGLRGIHKLEVPLNYPVSVLAGPNGCGKSTVLFSMACAYRSPGSGPREFVPSSLFPNFISQQEGFQSDSPGTIEIAFDYFIDGQSQQMRWRRKKSWNRSGIAGGKSPERTVYLRTLTNLTNPSEVRNLLQLGRRSLQKDQIDVADISLAHQILPWSYDDLIRVSKDKKELLFVTRDNRTVSYSEFHMSSGERAVLRLSLELSRLRNALVLIDEVEAGLHPFTQQVLMLELQRLSLRNKLQIIVATHSLVVLETVPVEARIFLERQGKNVVKQPIHHDVIQHAFYGRALDTLSIVCEDDSAEAFVRGVFDHLAPALDLVQGDLKVGRDTGKGEFKHHIKAFAGFQLLWKTLFVLDGDAQNLIPKLKAIGAEFGQSANVLCLPGTGAPELWVWEQIAKHPEDYSSLLGLSLNSLREMMDKIHQTYEGAADTDSNKAKGRVFALALQTGRETETLIRLVARKESERGGSLLQLLLNELQNVISSWRNKRGDL